MANDDRRCQTCRYAGFGPDGGECTHPQSVKGSISETLRTSCAGYRLWEEREKERASA